MTELIVFFDSFVFLIVIQQRFKLVYVNHASNMRHINFQFKNVDCHNNVELLNKNKTLKNVVFVFGIVKVRFALKKTCQIFAVFDSRVVHHYFFVIKQFGSNRLNYFYQFMFLFQNRYDRNSIYTVSNVFASDKVSKKLNVDKNKLQLLQKSDLVRKKQSRD